MLSEKILSPKLLGDVQRRATSPPSNRKVSDFRIENISGELNGVFCTEDGKKKFVCYTFKKQNQGDHFVYMNLSEKIFNTKTQEVLSCETDYPEYEPDGYARMCTGSNLPEKIENIFGLGDCGYLSYDSVSFRIKKVYTQGEKKILEGYVLENSNFEVHLYNRGKIDDLQKWYDNFRENFKRAYDYSCLALMQYHGVDMYNREKTYEFPMPIVQRNKGKSEKDLLQDIEREHHSPFIMAKLDKFIDPDSPQENKRKFLTPSPFVEVKLNVVNDGLFYEDERYKYYSNITEMFNKQVDPEKVCIVSKQLKNGDFPRVTRKGVVLYFESEDLTIDQMASTLSLTDFFAKFSKETFTYKRAFEIYLKFKELLSRQTLIEVAKKFNFYQEEKRKEPSGIFEKYEIDQRFLNGLVSLDTRYVVKENNPNIKYEQDIQPEQKDPLWEIASLSIRNHWSHERYQIEKQKIIDEMEKEKENFQKAQTLVRTNAVNTFSGQEYIREANHPNRLFKKISRERKKFVVRNSELFLDTLESSKRESNTFLLNFTSFYKNETPLLREHKAVICGTVVAFLASVEKLGIRLSPINPCKSVKILYRSDDSSFLEKLKKRGWDLFEHLTPNSKNINPFISEIFFLKNQVGLVLQLVGVTIDPISAANTFSLSVSRAIIDPRFGLVEQLKDTHEGLSLFTERPWDTSYNENFERIPSEDIKAEMREQMEMGFKIQVAQGPSVEKLLGHLMTSPVCEPGDGFEFPNCYLLNGKSDEISNIFSKLKNSKIKPFFQEMARKLFDLDITVLKSSTYVEIKK